MKKSFLAIAASSFMLLACGDDSSSSPATTEELCATAPLLSKGCLEGEWTLVRFEDAEGQEFFDPSDLAGGTLEFQVADSKSQTSQETFSYNSSVYSTLGYWSISEDGASFAQIKCTTGDPDCVPEVQNASAKIVGTDTLYISKNPFEYYPNTFLVPVEVYVRK